MAVWTTLANLPCEFPFRLGRILNRQAMSERDEGPRSTYSDVLIRATHHGYEHVQENNDHDRTIHAEHQQADEHGKRVLLVDLKCLQINQTERAPEERLQGFEQARTDGAVDNR